MNNNEIIALYRKCFDIIQSGEPLKQVLDMGFTPCKGIRSLLISYLTIIK